MGLEWKPLFGDFFFNFERLRPRLYENRGSNKEIWLRVTPEAKSNPFWSQSYMPLF